MMQNHNDTQLRQWAMLKCIPQYPRQITAREITERLASEGFEVGKRTIERDLLSLSGIFPLISNDRSRPYGWSWSKDAEAFALPTMSPLQALTLELAHDHLAALLPASLLDSLAPYFKCAEGVLNSGDGVKRLASWRKKVAIVSAGQPLIPPNYPEEIIEAVHSALLTGQQLEISYTPREHSETKTYPAHPLGIVQRGAVTYLVATLYNYTDILLFAVHRIQAAKVLDQPSTTPEGFDIKHYISQGALGFEENGLIKLVVRITVPAAEHLWETPLSLDQQITPDQSGWVRLQATVPDTAQLRWWLKGFGQEVEVLEPTLLRDEFFNMAQSLHVIYHTEAPS
ncbi:MAG: WYL domain-containing protein [Methylotenera sp.]|uniref:helix-turn-helix transcriptional regulator n=1 Tax=Methylotenera sp. TaxID=2051956 RepID=UPI0027230726|nr:WYL domain-containing protein [Methylotenera sp.]MDO9393925.1 WYL domain-containing protein [Methylotenera sp.]